MAVYRACTGNSNLFLNRLDNIIRALFKVNLNLIICGDINIDYLTASDKKGNLCDVTVLQSFGYSTFPYH